MTDAAATPATSTHFKCVPYASTLSRAACATRFVQVRNLRGARTSLGHPTDKRIRFAKCIGCPVGAAHSRGELAGEAVEPPKGAGIRAWVLDDATRKRIAREGCPACGIKPEAFEWRSSVWFREWGHRCPHGEPCPGATNHPTPPCCARAELEQEGRPQSAPPASIETPPAAEAPRPRLVRETAQPKERPMQTCAHCKNDFKAPGKRTYCSTDCRDKARAKDRPTSDLVDQAEQLSAQIKRERQPARAAKTARAPRSRPPASSTSSSPANGSAKPKLFAGPRELLELAGYTVEEVATPKGILLFVGVAS